MSFRGGHSAVTDQFKRAAMSIPLNIAEGAGKRHKADCRKYFDIARGSAMECGATIDVCHILGLVSDVKKTPITISSEIISFPCLAGGGYFGKCCGVTNNYLYIRHINALFCYP
jgi:four helix bundle protein